MVRTPWPGRVVAITPWYGAEYGVTVRLSNGLEAKFGHISPSVRVGQAISRGQPLGSVVVDHVDVKMTDANGYVDFGVHRVRSETLAVGEGTAAKARPHLSAEEKRAASEAFLRYREEIAVLAQEEEQVRRGLLPAKTADGRRARLDRLRPLARVHTSRLGTSLPKRRTLSPVIEVEAGRPVTDQLLGLPNTQERSMEIE